MCLSLLLVFFHVFDFWKKNTLIYTQNQYLIYMKILILGVTGRLGSKIARLLLRQKHEIVGFSSNTSKLYVQNDLVDLQEGDVTNYENVLDVMTKCELVISALGSRSSNKPLTILPIAIQNIINAMQSQKLKRIIVLSNIGILQETEDSLRKDSEKFPVFLKESAEQHYEAYQILKKTELEWTLVCPANMPNEEHTSIYRVEEDYLPQNGRWISVEDVADFVVKEVDRKIYLRKKVGLAY